MPDLKLAKLQTSKECSVCKVVKNHSEYSRHKRHADGFSSSCKDCRNSSRRTDGYRVQSRKTQKVWRDRNPERNKAYTKKFRESEYGQKWILNDSLQRNYGVTLEQYNKMFAAQGGRCAICTRHQSEFSKRLHVDHDHLVGTVRELLCHHCNTALGAFDESPSLLLAAIKYIKKHS